MIEPGNTAAGRFCWIDLAATDTATAAGFYRRLFGWDASADRANGGSFLRLSMQGRDVASIYQLDRDHLGNGVPSHWTPYVRVRDIDDAVRAAAVLGGAVIVRPFEVEGVARIALILDAVGATIGLWQPLDAGEGAHG